MSDGTDLCARCDRLDLVTDLAQVKMGRGRCLGHEGGSPSRPAFAAWNDQACVLFIPARQMAARERWVEKWQAKQQNEVETEAKG